MTTQIKGMAIVGAIQRIKELHGEDGFQRVLDELNEEDKKLLGGTILASIWYSLDSFSDFLNAEVKVLNAGDNRRLQKASEDIVSNQLKGIYRIFVKLGSPEFVIGRISSVHNSYFKGIELTKEISDGKFIGHYRGYNTNHGVFEDIIIGFYKKALELSGAKNINAKFDIPITADKELAQITVTWSK